jgi:hypothetical protein
VKRAPAPSEDIEARARERARAEGAGRSSGYISEPTCHPLALLAALFPDRLLSLVMGEVERMANDPLPVAQRAPRIAALERELDELHRDDARRQDSGQSFARRLMSRLSGARRTRPCACRRSTTPHSTRTLWPLARKWPPSAPQPDG